MSAACSHYEHLKARLDELRSKFLGDELRKELQEPLTFSPDIDKIAAFKLLFHAEIEMFLEEKARERVLLIEKLIKNSQPWQRDNPQFFALQHLLGCGDTLPKEFKQEQILAQLAQLLGRAKKAISENKGVKETSFVTLSLIAGKTTEEISAAITATLNSIGTERGEIAHRSVPRTSVIRAPSAEDHSATSLVAELGAYFGAA